MDVHTVTMESASGEGGTPGGHLYLKNTHYHRVGQRSMIGEYQAPSLYEILGTHRSTE